MKRSASMLALVPDAFGGRGGIAQYNRDFLTALIQTEAVTSITVFPRHAPDLSIPPAGIVQVRARSSRVVYALAALATSLRRRFDLVFCGHLFMVPLAAWIARINGAKLIVQAHGIEAWPRPSRLQRIALESADLVLCVSRYTRAALLTWADIASERVVVVPNTVREAFTPGDGSLMRTEMGLEGKRILLTVSRMDASQRYKGQDRVIAALPYQIAHGHDVVYLIVGEGDDRPRLEALAREMGVEDRVRFLGGVGLERLGEIYRMADLFVMPSTGEGFGIVFLEAMASGTPALGLSVTGAVDALADGHLGTVTTEEELPLSIARILALPKPDPYVLASAVGDRFGRDLFVRGAAAAIEQLLEPA